MVFVGFCKNRIFAPEMRRSIAILSLVLAYVSMSLLAIVPHHHHDGEVCFVLDGSEVVCETHNVCHHHDCEDTSHDSGCSLSTVVHEALNGSELRVATPDVAWHLPEWICCCDECREAELCVEHRYNIFSPTPYEAPDIRSVSLRAPPAV